VELMTEGETKKLRDHVHATPHAMIVFNRAEALALLDEWKRAENAEAELSRVRADAAAMAKMLSNLVAVSKESEGIAGGAILTWDDVGIDDIEHALAANPGAAILAEMEQLRARTTSSQPRETKFKISATTERAQSSTT
jgi:hypothetical protein